MLPSAIAQEMLSYFNQLNEVEQQTFLKLLKTFFQNRQEDLSPQSLEDYNREIDEACAEIDAGVFITHEDVLKYFNRGK